MLLLLLSNFLFGLQSLRHLHNVKSKIKSCNFLIFKYLTFFPFHSKIFIWQTCNALFILRVVFSHWVYVEREADLVKKFTVKNEDTYESLLENLVVQLVEILVDVPLKEETALLHMECIQTLLLLVYSAASTYISNNKSVIFR